MTSSPLSQLLGPSALTAIAVFVSLLPLNFFITKKRNHHQVWHRAEGNTPGEMGRRACREVGGEGFVPTSSHRDGRQLHPSNIQATHQPWVSLDAFFSHPIRQLTWLVSPSKCIQNYCPFSPQALQAPLSLTWMTAGTPSPHFCPHPRPWPLHTPARGRL